MYYKYGKHHMVDAAELLEQVAQLPRLTMREREAIWEGYHFLSSVIVADEQRQTELVH